MVRAVLQDYCSQKQVQNAINAQAQWNEQAHAQTATVSATPMS